MCVTYLTKILDAANSLIKNNTNRLGKNLWTDLHEGNDIEITVFSGAHHSFDRDQELEIIDDAYSFTDCRMTISDNGIVRSSILGFPLSSPLFQKIGLSICAKRGTTFGGNKQARDKSKIIAIDFMNKYLMNN